MRDQLPAAKKFLKTHFFFFLSLILALALRVYRIDTLTTFGRDQGIDFISVYKIIATRKPTLLGIKVSLGEFFQGPIYLYLLLPLFYLLNFNPLAGAYTALLVSLITLIIIYRLTSQIFGKKSANFSALLFAVSTELVTYGNTPLYQHFAPLFMTTSLFFFWKFIRKNKPLDVLLTGLAAGLAMETHWLFSSFSLAVFIYLTLRKLKLIPTYLFGLLLGLLPTIVFELRHNFLNTHLFANYLHQGNRLSDNWLVKTQVWLRALAIFFGGRNLYLGSILGLGLIIFLVFKKLKNKKNKAWFNLFWLLAITSLIISAKMSSLQPHYFLPLWIIVLIILPAVFFKGFGRKWGNLTLISLVGFNLLATVSQLNLNHGYHMPPGWSLKKIEKTAELIAQDSKNYQNFNVASLLDGDTRTYPLRYSLLTRELAIGRVEDYPQNDHLYLVAPKSKNIQADVPWEITSMKPFFIGRRWDLGEGIILYRLDKN